MNALHFKTFFITFQVEQLTTHLKEKTDKCSELLLCKEQLQRDVQERNEELEKLECRVRELEQALLVSVRTTSPPSRPVLVAAALSYTSQSFPVKASRCCLHPFFLIQED